MQQSLASYACHQPLRVGDRQEMGWNCHGLLLPEAGLLVDVSAAWCRAELVELGQRCLLLQLLPAPSCADTVCWCWLGES